MKQVRAMDLQAGMKTEWYVVKSIRLLPPQNVCRVIATVQWNNDGGISERIWDDPLHMVPVI